MSFLHPVMYSCICLFIHSFILYCEKHKYSSNLIILEDINKAQSLPLKYRADNTKIQKANHIRDQGSPKWEKDTLMSSDQDSH